MAESNPDTQAGYFTPQADEIGLGELFAILWRGKWWIIIISLLCAVGSVLYALSLPNQYTASAVVAPASSDQGNNLSQIGSQLGGLASLAGISLQGGESNDAVVAINIARSWEFTDRFVRQHDLELPILASKGWNKSKNSLVFDSNHYDDTQGKWIQDSGMLNDEGKPSSWKIFREFKENFAINQEKDTGLINIKFTHYSPYVARQIVETVVTDINKLMNDKALDDAAKNIDYLTAQIEKTSLAEMKSVFYSLIEEQLKTTMLAEASDEYVFRTVSKAMLPEEKSKPSRALICIAITVLGFIFSVLLVLIRHQIKT